MKKHIYIIGIALLSFAVGSCIDEVQPTSVLSAEQTKGLSNVQESMLNGLASYMVAYNSWGSSGDYLNDWGYPCQIYFRELCGPDFPVAKSSYDYWTYYENCTYCSTYPYYTWNYYYRLIKNANNLIASVNGDTTNVDSKHYLGGALAFRAMAYLDLARLFEFKPTGYAKLDNPADANGIWGLTVPIVDENTTNEDILQNPRVDWCTMYRFIMTDLNMAAKCLEDYDFDGEKSLPGENAVYGLMARVWMEIGSRYDETLPQLLGYTEKMQKSDTSGDKYDTLGVYTATECYNLADSCATRAMEAYTYMTSDEWHDPTTGFNTVNDSWIWRMRIGGKEQFPAYYCSYLGQAATEPSSALGRYGGAYRCISSELFNRISTYDWRVTTWLSPSDKGKTSLLILNKYKTLVSDEVFASFPSYVNFKFRPGSGNTEDYNTWLISDFPLMRKEEMEFIKIEAMAHVDKGACTRALNELKTFISKNRYTNSKKYEPTATTYETFMDELMLQKRIEFWGEGILFFDYKRLNMQVDRTLSSNVEEAFKLRSKLGYCCPWMNFFIMQYETNRNSACKANPDVSYYWSGEE